jgi:hypothetical protein
MQKSISFPAFLTAAIAAGLFALPTKAVPNQEKSISVADVAGLYQPDEQTTNLALTSNLGDRTWLDTAGADTSTSSTDNLNKIIGITGLSLGAGYIAYRLNQANKPSATKSLAYSNTNTLLLDRLSPKLRKKLLQLIHNRETANRLLTGAMFNHAGRSPNWLAEKVIYDLERDRL